MNPSKLRSHSRIYRQSIIGGLTLLMGMLSLSRPAMAVESRVCYIIADSGGSNGGNDLLIKVDETTGASVVIGTGTGTNRIEAAAAQPNTNVLFASNQQSSSVGQLGTISLTTGVFTPRPQVIGTGSGSRGNITFADPDGLAFNPATGDLYASIRTGDGSAPPDILIRLNPDTGAHIPNAFGPNVDYVEIQPQSNRNDIDGLAFAPSNAKNGAVAGTLYGIANQGSGNPQILVAINPSTGATTTVGTVPLSDVEDLAFDTLGQLYATTGAGETLYDLNISGSTITPANPSSPGFGGDYESSACFLLPPVDVSLQKSVDNTTPIPGETVEFTLTLTNDQTSNAFHDANTLQIIDALPTGLSFVAFTNTPSGTTATENSGTITWNVDEVLLGQNKQLRFTALVTGSGTITNSAEVVAMREFDIDSTPNNNQAAEDDQDAETLSTVPGFTIGDRVWYDLDNDGNQDSNEVGIPGVTVNLRQGTCGSGGSITNTETTGSNGLYNFTGLIPGNYCVEVVNSTLPASGYSHTTSNDPLDVTISGSNITTADFGYRSTGCLPRLDFETDAAGNPLSAGTILDDEWAPWGIQISSDNQTSRPAMLFNSAAPTGGDVDLGAPHTSFGGPGVGDGGVSGLPGANSQPQGLIMIINEDTDTSDPDDFANGGTLTLTFDTPLQVDELTILDTDADRFLGRVRAYDAGNTLLSESPIIGYGDNSFQTVPVNASNVSRLEVVFETSGSVPTIDFCAPAPTPLGSIGDTIWQDLNPDGIRVGGESGIPNVDLELHIPGLTGVVAVAQSGANGLYQFPNLANGSYEVKIADSNFNSGGTLEGQSYSPLNVGTDDAIDSDFDSGTGRAPAIVSGANATTTVDGGFFQPLTNSPNLLLVKRITRINGQTTNGSIDLDTYIDDPNHPYDDNILDNPAPDPIDTENWPTPSSFLKGAIEGGQTMPGDEIEYSIYFLSTGGTEAVDVKICDRVPDFQTFVPDTFNSVPPSPGVGLGTNRGTLVEYNGNIFSYSNDNDSDIVQYYPSGSILPSVCNNAPAQTEDNGAVVVNLGNLPNATGSGTPNTSYGVIRFRANVK